MGLLLRPGTSLPLAQQVQSPAGAPIGEVFRFASGLYFRGKLAYAAAFARPPPGVPGALVIAPGAGLVPCEARAKAQALRDLAAVPVDGRDPRYRLPLQRDARLLARRLGPRDSVVLLGSIASAKYLEVLLEILRRHLLFPADFVGRGDMSRGGLLLRAAQAGSELRYVPAAGAVRHGPRPPRLTPLRSTAAGHSPP